MSRSLELKPDDRVYLKVDAAKAKWIVEAVDTDGTTSLVNDDASARRTASLSELARWKKWRAGNGAEKSETVEPPESTESSGLPSNGADSSPSDDPPACQICDGTGKVTLVSGEGGEESKPSSCEECEGSGVVGGKVAAKAAKKAKKEKKPKAERRTHDEYETPAVLCAAICHFLRDEFGSDSTPFSPALVLEPSAAGGRFVIASKSTWPDAGVGAVELREECRGPLMAAGADFVHIGKWEDAAKIEGDLDTGPSLGAEIVSAGGADLIVGNPPYTSWAEHVEAALPLLAETGKLAFLLRINNLGGQARNREFWSRVWPWLEGIAHLPERPSFTADSGDRGTDSTEYGIYVFSKPFPDRRPVLYGAIWYAEG